MQLFFFIIIQCIWIKTLQIYIKKFKDQFNFLKFNNCLKIMLREREREQHVCIPDRACSKSSCQLSIEFLHIISLISQIHYRYMMHIPVCLANTFLVKLHFGCLYTWTTKAPAMYILPLAGKWYKFDQIIACYCYSLVHYWFAADEYYWKLICPSPCLQVAGILIADTARLYSFVHIYLWCS